MTVQDLEVDSCPKCAGVFLDADEGAVIGVDTGMLFGFNALPKGKSKRLCPDHHKAMARFEVGTPSGPVEVERAECCGGTFLDAGEGYAISRTNAPPLPPAASHYPPGVTPPAPSHPPAGVVPQYGMPCPQCATGLELRIFHEVNVDECVPCGSFFLGGGEAELSGIDTAALFADAPWGTPSIGPSPLACPRCRVAMMLYRPTILGASIDAHFAACCNGLWMKRADEKHMQSASRLAVTKRADAQYAAGEEVQPTAAARTRAQETASEAARQVHRQAVVAHARERRILMEIRSRQTRRNDDW